MESAVVVEGDALGAQEGDLAGDVGAVAVSAETADGAVGGEDAVAGDARGEGVVAQCAADGLRRRAPDAPREPP